MKCPRPEDVFRSCVDEILLPHERLMVAVSGGSDSVALLGVAARCLPGRVQVVHVRHGVRADDHLEAELVQSLSDGLGLSCEVIEAPADGPAGHSETACRRRRLHALATAAARAGTPMVATGHHRDDALETLLLHLSRGHRGDRSLASIPTLRPLGERATGGGRAAGGLLRPFLYGDPAPGRAELTATRHELGLPCLEDPTNANGRIPRNRLRQLLANDEPPLTTSRLDALRCAARRRLQRRLLAVAAALERGLRPRGLGASLDRAAFEPPAGDTPEAWHSELLRLLGASLASPLRVAPRRTLLVELARRLSAGRGVVQIPAHPHAMALHVSPQEVHLPDLALDLDGHPMARVLRAVGRTSQHLMAPTVAAIDAP